MLLFWSFILNHPWAEARNMMTRGKCETKWRKHETRAS
jgi:hypothetical protein